MIVLHIKQFEVEFPPDIYKSTPYLYDTTPKAYYDIQYLPGLLFSHCIKTVFFSVLI